MELFSVWCEEGGGAFWDGKVEVVGGEICFEGGEICGRSRFQSV